MKRIAREWESYQQKVLPPDAGPVQIQECRRAFYAGARSLFTLLAVGVSPGMDEPTADDLNMMQEISDELDEFLGAVVSGRS